MNSATSKMKWKKTDRKSGINVHHQDDFPHAHITRPREKQGKQKFKLQCEVDEYLSLASTH